jgi:hypothetical protein
MYVVPSSDSAAAGVVEVEGDEEAKYQVYIVSRVLLYSAVRLVPWLSGQFYFRFRAQMDIAVLEPGSQSLLDIYSST